MPLTLSAVKPRNQGQVSWLKEVKRNPKKMKAMMQSYFKAVKEAADAGLKRATRSLAQYIESVESESKTSTIDHGQMMWEGQAKKFWQSVEGGSHTEQQATSLWNDFLVTIDEHITDRKGPKTAPLRFRVHTADFVDYSASYLKRKSLALMREDAE